MTKFEKAFRKSFYEMFAEKSIRKYLKNIQIILSKNEDLSDRLLTEITDTNVKIQAFSKNIFFLAFWAFFWIFFHLFFLVCCWFHISRLFVLMFSQKVINSLLIFFSFKYFSLIKSFNIFPLRCFCFIDVTFSPSHTKIRPMSFTLSFQNSTPPPITRRFINFSRNLAKFILIMYSK